MRCCYGESACCTWLEPLQLHADADNCERSLELSCREGTPLPDAGDGVHASVP